MHATRDEEPRTRKRLGEALRDLLIERGTTTMVGNPDWAAFAREAGLGYESLRKAVVAERHPSDEVVAKIAQALDLPPEYFVEWRVARLKERLDIGDLDPTARPEKFARALAALDAYELGERIIAEHAHVSSLDMSSLVERALALLGRLDEQA